MFKLVCVNRVTTYILVTCNLFRDVQVNTEVSGYCNVGVQNRLVFFLLVSVLIVRMCISWHLLHFIMTVLSIACPF